MHLRFSYLPWMSGSLPPPAGSRPRAPGHGALPLAGHAAGEERGGAGPLPRLPRPRRAARTHPCALREVVPAERVVQVEAHHVAVSQGKVLLHRRAAAAAGGRRRRRRKRREEEGARAALPAEPRRAERSGDRGMPSARPAPAGPPSPAAQPLGQPGDGGAGTGRMAGGVSKRSNSKNTLPAEALCAWEQAWERWAPSPLTDRKRESSGGVCWDLVSREQAGNRSQPWLVTGQSVPHRKGPAGDN